MQRGHNTDHGPLMARPNSSPIFTRWLAVDDVPVVTIDGVRYRELQCST